MSLIVTNVKPVDYPLLSELAKRLGIQIEENGNFLPTDVVSGVKKR